jgi:hypothetical protein
MTPNVNVANLSASSGAELGDAELDLVVGADWGGVSRYAEAWALHESSAAPTPDQWSAWGQQLAAAYQANHSTHLGSPLK